MEPGGQVVLFLELTPFLRREKLRRLRSLDIHASLLNVKYPITVDPDFYVSSAYFKSASCRGRGG
jgi:hypothetical protein